MDAITKHHYDNVRNNAAVRNRDGSLSTVRTIIMGDGTRDYLIPTVWDGEILSDQEAFDRAMASGVEWPSAKSSEDGMKQLENIDAAIHEGFNAETTPKEAEDIMLRGADYPTSGLVGSLISPRPEPRPEVTISQNDIDKMERVVWGEARGETPEGRDAIRGVILNRLASGRFGSTMDEVLTADQFNTIKDHGDGDIYKIPVPPEVLQKQIAEAADYISLGRDVTGGRAFYQVEDAKGAYEGTDPIKVGEHTFYKGIKGQEPVEDVSFSHNTRIVADENDKLADAGFASGGLALSDATKGIKTQEGKDMANKKFQLDQTGADKNNDGQISEFEKKQKEAEQMAKVDSGAIELDRADKALGMACGGMMTAPDDIDPISGNPIPLGSNPENVRDDIEANISQDEYVLPAHVVKWHGLKHIQEMQMEAEAGLMSMAMEGLISGYEQEESAETGEYEASETSDHEASEKADAGEIEEPTVEVDDAMEDTEYEDVPEESPLPGMMKKQKYAFIMS